ncbi:MAG: diguanylate cyclase [Defluviitaleaceae bacterium]|nr:diguanylate cyclase [Defluviitaleaceae bacterium]
MDKENSILVVDDEILNITALTHILSPLYTIYVAKNGISAINLAKERLPDVILSDVLMPGMSGFEVIAELKSNELTENIPVIFITGLTQSVEEEKGLELGAADYIHKPFNPTIVKLRVQNQMQIVNQMRMIQHLSITDALTNTSNRRHFNSRISQEWQRSMRESTPLSLLLLDIDDFKKINDTYGHLVGDSVLQNVAETIKRCLLRPMDLIARWGGEEFAVLLPNTTLDGATSVAEKIRSAIETKQYSSGELLNIHTTISIGVSTITTVVPLFDITVYDFISEADKALYRAKELGKNRVCCAPRLIM